MLPEGRFFSAWSWYQVVNVVKFGHKPSPNLWKFLAISMIMCHKISTFWAGISRHHHLFRSFYGISTIPDHPQKSGKTHGGSRWHPQATATARPRPRSSRVAPRSASWTPEATAMPGRQRPPGVWGLRICDIAMMDGLMINYRLYWLDDWLASINTKNIIQLVCRWLIDGWFVVLMSSLLMIYWAKHGDFQ